MSDLDWFYLVAAWCEDSGLDLSNIVETLDKQPSYVAAHKQFGKGATRRVLRQLLDAALVEMTDAAG